jgi:hypothetical protein
MLLSWTERCGGAVRTDHIPARRGKSESKKLKQLL